MNDKDIFNFLKGFAIKDKKEDIIQNYIKGLISKEEYFKKMRELK